ncbi:hypothetical protein APHAL10511_003969 [Amanita phalloides]|nr:hypothetical protein APHAL10511_003969 [Amanita phalloides]
MLLESLRPVVFPKGKGLCPLCRTFIGPDLKNCVKPISLEFVPTKVALAELVVDGLSRMDESSKVVSVDRAPAKLQKAVDELTLDQDLANSLLQAVTDFKERIAPVFKEVNEQKDELQRLQIVLNESVAQNERTEISTAKLQSLEDRLLEVCKIQEQVEMERDHVAEAAAKATDELCTTRTDNTLLNAHVSTLEKEIASLKGYLQQYKIAERKSKIKRKELQRRLEELEHKTSANDEAADLTLVTAPPSDIDLDDDALKNAPRASSRNRNDTLPIQLTVESQYDFEGMPRPGFSSNWKSSEHRHVKRMKLSSVKEITNFPIALDRFSRPTAPVQYGPKKKIRVRDP